MISIEAIGAAAQDAVAAIVHEARERNCDMQVVLVGPVNEMFVKGGLRHTLDVVVGGSNPSEFFHHAFGLDLSGNSALALVTRSAIISLLESAAWPCMSCSTKQSRLSSRIIRTTTGGFPPFAPCRNIEDAKPIGA